MRVVACRLLHLGLISHVLLAACLAAEPVIGLRNNGTGAYPDADPPMRWSATSNVVWRWEAPLLGTTISSAIIVGGRIVTVAHPMTLVCLDKNTGQVLWQRESHLCEKSDDTVKAMHEAIMRDFRMCELEVRGAGKGGAAAAEVARIAKRFVGRAGEVSSGLGAFRRRGGKGGEVTRPIWATDVEAEYFQRRAQAYKELREDGASNKEASETEWQKLKAQRPDRSKPGYTADGYVCGATPASDGERIVALFLPGLAVCYDLDGNLLWTHGVSKNGRDPGMGSAVCPAMGDGKVILDCGDILRCLNVTDGTEVWSRDCSKMNRSFGWSAASPVIGQAGGVYYFMCHQGDVRRLDTGEVVVSTLWRTDDTYPKQKLDRYWQNSITADRKTFHCVSQAVRIPDDPSKPAFLLWALKPEGLDIVKNKEGYLFGGSHQYCAPMIAGGKVHVFTTGGYGPMTVLDAETGKVLWGPKGKCGGQYNDAVFAGKYIYRFDEDGSCTILDPEKEYEVIAENKLEVGLNMIPVFEGRRMYVRTDVSLYCIEEPSNGKRATE